MSQKPVYMAAFDHEVEFDAIFAEGETPTDAERETIRYVKGVIFDGIERVIDRGEVAVDESGMLIDELYGEAVVKRGRERGVGYAMPVEPPSREFIFRFEDWQEHLLEQRPTWAKALLWYNIEGDEAKNTRQLERVLRLQTWVRENGGGLMVEFIIPAEPAQAARVGGNADRFKAEILPGLIAGAMTALVEAGVDPDLWKVEGVPTPAGTALIGKTAQSLGRGAGVLVLGSGADLDSVGEWLTVAGATPGYAGFAVGRSIWADAVARWKLDRDDEELASTVAERYSALVSAFRSTR